MITSEIPQVTETGRYSVTRTAQILSVSRQTVYTYIKDGKLKASYRRANNRMFILGSEILRLWKSIY